MPSCDNFCTKVSVAWFAAPPYPLTRLPFFGQVNGDNPVVKQNLRSDNMPISLLFVPPYTRGVLQGKDG
jgi:hypothetical protein